jgi:hypothetical protein
MYLDTSVTGIPLPTEMDFGVPAKKRPCTTKKTIIDTNIFYGAPKSVCSTKIFL